MNAKTIIPLIPPQLSLEITSLADAEEVVAVQNMPDLENPERIITSGTSS